MHTAKRAKRVRETDNQGLEDLIATRRAALVAARHEAPQLYAQAAALREHSKTLTARWQTRQRADTLMHAQELEAEADARCSMSREHDFEATVVTYLRSYHQREAIVPTSRKNDAIAAYARSAETTGQRRAAILDEYLIEMNQAPPKVAMAARDECPRCDVKLLLCSAKSIMSCSQCGYAVAYLDATSASTAFDEVIEFSQYSYKKINHWIGWLLLVQGREAHRVDDEVLQLVMRDLYETQNVRKPEEVTQQRVRESLRRLRLRRAYDHVAQVTARISGIRPLRISATVEEQLRNMFLQMQPAFVRHAPKTRTNFLSYPYVLYRCFQILGMPHMLEGIALLKGRDKLEANDAIFRKMSHDLGWPVFDLPSDR